MATALVRSIETVGPTAPVALYPRWLILHVRSGLEHTTKGRAQYAHPALDLAICEGFATRLIDAGYEFPSFAECEFVEIIESRDVKVDFAANPKPEGLETAGVA
jgi:hypothetical protein